jgi:hypothetical protein
MKEDIVMERIHKTRKQMFHDCGDSIKNMFEKIKSIELKYKDNVVSSPRERKDKKN